MAHLTDLSRVKEPLSTANGLPNAHYIDPAVFAEERDALLFGQWAGLAVAAMYQRQGTPNQSPLWACRCYCCVIAMIRCACSKTLPPPWDDFGGRTPQDRGCHPLPLSQLVLFNRRQTCLTPMLVDQVKTRIQMWIARHWALRNSQPHLARCCVGECGWTGPRI